MSLGKEAAACDTMVGDGAVFFGFFALDLDLVAYTMLTHKYGLWLLLVNMLVKTNQNPAYTTPFYLLITILLTYFYMYLLYKDS